MDTTAPTTQNDQDYLVIALAVGIPASVVIVVLVVVISVMFVLMLKKSGNEEEIEAMYIRRRFQGLSLEEQKRLQKKKGKKVDRRRSSAAESRVSQMTPNTRSARIRSVNPFGLQEWQLKLSGIDLDVDTEETDIDGEEERKPMGALNPLMMAGVDEDAADYEPVRQQPLKKTTQTRTSYSQPRSKARHHGNIHVPAPQEESDGDSSDSFNPYD